MEKAPTRAYSWLKVPAVIMKINGSFAALITLLMLMFLMPSP